MASAHADFLISAHCAAMRSPRRGRKDPVTPAAGSWRALVYARLAKTIEFVDAGPVAVLGQKLQRVHGGSACALVILSQHQTTGCVLITKHQQRTEVTLLKYAIMVKLLHCNRRF